ncbi:helix-turn-helix domain-containing protein [Shewanella sp. MMG014]|uniref:winged helix-turn-helix domain-containing protein n=1 Tax=Shewanella sp. MMG014 TaxID=2822691 RepID=UPI001B37BF33|nr:helix-turn-helix domain-containing protein [Shewanella sp. MMG014]MBQ4890431.1 helix-turn-helix domain-containing protein [Shewanella sp. MMG014]
MHLGHCRFNKAKGELTNQQTGDVWHLPRAERQVLSLLIDYQGQVVAKPLLKKGDEQAPPLSDASVTHAIFTLRAFLGPQYETLIETVKGQGYLLKPHRSRKHQSQRLPSNVIILATCIGIFVIVSIMTTIILWGQFSETATSPAQPFSESTVTLASGKTVDVILYSSSKTNNALLKEQGTQLEQSLAECKQSSLQSVYLSLSHDEQVLNITLRGELIGQSVIRNLKISDLRQPKKFVSQQWLKGVEICD